MEKITKKVLAIVLVLSLFAGFGAVASFATEEDIGLGDSVPKNAVCKRVDFGNMPADLKYYIKYERSYNRQSGGGWVRIGDILYFLLSHYYDNVVTIADICPYTREAAEVEEIIIPKKIKNLWVSTVAFCSKQKVGEKFKNLKTIKVPGGINLYNGFFRGSKEVDVVIPEGEVCKLLKSDEDEDEPTGENVSGTIKFNV